MPYRLLGAAPLSILGAPWHYAAWVALDVRLLCFLVLIATLGALGITAMFLRHDRLSEHVATFIVTFTALFIVLVVIFNAVAHYPVFVVERFFPFP